MTSLAIKAIVVWLLVALLALDSWLAWVAGFFVIYAAAWFDQRVGGPSSAGASLNG
jgi:hypothetical protein